MKYTLWFYDNFHEKNGRIPFYDIFTGTRYECYKLRNSKSFREQYKVKICTW